MMMDNNFPVIAHVMRGYLGRTETFIGNQIITLRNYRPVIFCHHQFNGHGYPQNNVISVANNLSPCNSIFDKIAYSSIRLLIPMAVNVLAQQASRLSVDLIHFHFLVDARFFLSFKRKTGLPAIASAYGYDVSSFPRRYKGYGRKYLKPIFTEIEFFTAMSQDMKKDMINLGCPEEKIIVHYHGIDTKRFVYPDRTYSDKGEVNILVCGTLEIKKAQHLVLKALRLMEKQRMTKKNFHITFVGDGPMRPHLEHQVKDYGWEKKVTFAGFIPHHTEDLVSEYKKAHIFSLPSITVKGDKEGIPGTIVEAMASGLPVISTYHAGIPEIIESNHHGILVNEREIDALANAFAQMIEDPKLRERLGKAAAERATTELDLCAKTVKLEGIYKSLLINKS